MDVEIYEDWGNKVVAAERSCRGLAGGALDGEHGHCLCFQALVYENAHGLFSEWGVHEAAAVRWRSAAERGCAAEKLRCDFAWIRIDPVGERNLQRNGGDVGMQLLLREDWVVCLYVWLYQGSERWAAAWAERINKAAA